MGKCEWKKPLWRPTHMWEDNNRIGFKEIGLGWVEWIHVAQDRDQCNEIWIFNKHGTRKQNPVHHEASNKGNSILAHYLWVIMMSNFPCKHNVWVSKNSIYLLDCTLTANFYVCTVHFTPTMMLVTQYIQYWIIGQQVNNEL